VGNVSTFLPGWIPTPGNLRYRRTIRQYRERMDGLVDRRRRSGDDGDDLLSILLHAEGEDGTTLSEAEVRDNLLTFMFAGHETSSLALTYAFLLLSQNPDAMQSLREEHERVLGAESPGFEHVPRLEFTENVVTESMRLHPPAHIIIRRAVEDSVVGGYRIPEGTILTLPQFYIHRDDRWYDAPDEFRPERWTDGFEAELPEYAYFPFGGGPRHCIGMRFAMLELQLAVSVFAREFDFELLSDPDPEIGAGATHVPKNDVRVRVHRR
jgi:cytochrome P450